MAFLPAAFSVHLNANHGVTVVVCGHKSLGKVMLFIQLGGKLPHISVLPRLPVVFDIKQSFPLES